MAKIVIEIDKCDKCPFVKTKRTETHDWFEDYALDYYCGKNQKEIAGWIERDYEMPDVPKWCPCLLSE